MTKEELCIEIVGTMFTSAVDVNRTRGASEVFMETSINLKSKPNNTSASTRHGEPAIVCVVDNSSRL